VCSVSKEKERPRSNKRAVNPEEEGEEDGEGENET
jgi:hypothetical protein